MKRLFIILAVLLWGYELSANSKVQQTIFYRNDTTFVVSNNQEYKLIPIVSVKYSNYPDLSKKYDVVRYNKLNYADLEIPQKSSLENFIKELEGDLNILEIEYNSEGHYLSFIPNDYYWSDMWHLVAIKAPQAWDITTGDPFVKVAVLDSGTDWEHPDLGMGNDSYQNIYCNLAEDDWTNPVNPATGNHVDDDYNGFIDDYKGWNFDLNSNDSRGTFYHGTFVAGVIGAKTNNSRGIAGVAGGNNSPGVSIIPYCVGMIDPNSSIIDDAIIAAVDNGARIIQLSIDCQSTNSIKSALQYAKNNEVVVVCASGNSNWFWLPFPASDTTVIAVGGITSSFKRVDFSSYGSNLRLVAPGVGIRGLDLTSATPPYIQYGSGTSFAAPQVSGVLSLMLSVNPCLTRRELINIIESTAQKVGNYSYTLHSGKPNGTWNNQMGYGLVDAYAAVLAAQNKYIQNITYNHGTNVFESYPKIIAGYSVTNETSPGDVTIKSGSQVQYYASNSIHLKQGFKVERGANFTASIGPCSSNTSSNSMQLRHNSLQQDPSYQSPIENGNISGDAPEEESLCIPATIKILRDGQILILRGNKTYTITGQELY